MHPILQRFVLSMSVAVVARHCSSKLRRYFWWDISQTWNSANAAPAPIGVGRWCSQIKVLLIFEDFHPTVSVSLLQHSRSMIMFSQHSKPSDAFIHRLYKEEAQRLCCREKCKIYANDTLSSIMYDDFSYTASKTVSSLASLLGCGITDLLTLKISGYSISKLSPDGLPGVDIQLDDSVSFVLRFSRKCWHKRHNTWSSRAPFFNQSLTVSSSLWIGNLNWCTYLSS